MEKMGWEAYKPNASDIGRIMVIPKSDYAIDRSKIPEYFTEDNNAKIRFFFKYKAFGWPFNGGWAEQPAYLVDIVERLESEMGRREKANG